VLLKVLIRRLSMILMRKMTSLISKSLRINLEWSSERMKNREQEWKYGNQTLPQKPIR
jgi:hypothetical protein